MIILRSPLARLGQIPTKACLTVRQVVLAAVCGRTPKLYDTQRASIQ